MDGVRERWTTELGGLLSASTAAARLGIEERALHAGASVYPGFQFQHGWPPSALVEAWRLIAGASYPWTAALWAATLDDALSGDAPQIARSADAARMLEIAWHDAARLAA